MIEYVIKSDSNRETKKIVKYIEGFHPKINFEIEKIHFNSEILESINCKFENESERDLFIKALSEGLGISETGEYLS